MLIIPMSSVTERRGDDRCPTVKWTWALCFGPCSTAQKWTSSTRWAFRSSPEQEPPKSSCSGTRMMTLVGRSSGEASFVELCRGGECLREYRGILCGIVAHLLRSMDVTWMDKPFHLLSPRVKAIVIALKYSSDPHESWPLDQSNGSDPDGAFSRRADSLHLSQAYGSRLFARFFDIFVTIKLPSVMAEEQAPASTSNVDGDDYAWVADAPRTTISKFSLNGGDGMFRTVQRSPADDWKACIPNTNRRICSKFQWGSFPMYQIAFEQMGYKLPFSDFEVAVFRYLHLTPSQLHPNSLAFIRAFEMTAAYLGFLPTIPLFFHAFHLQRSKPLGDAANKFGWVSLKHSTKLFEMFLEFVRGFKDSYFFIKPLNSVSWQSIIYRGPAKDATGAPLIGPDGRPILEDYSRFPLSWRKSHYLKPASDFIYSTEELTVEELSNYKQMKVFVGSFPRKTYEDEDGNVVLDDSGVPLTKKCFIDTRRLFACKSAAEMEACFREMSSIAAKLPLVSRIFELEARQLDAAKSSFDNAVAQLMVLNPGVDLVVEGASELKEVQDGVIVSPAIEED
ncbi:hypothetical protein TSUD_237810 [Trifolium subterraneum]|uniref:Transposase (putative) gypsy type domain-containing protein n=1 Tax=Trifolium subterraneum TaxID=3900 RepID=A0A2Z6N2M0_TRISU|nr:hypothetical protein TSUD_237810 [Trifolium subterraneum]